MTNSYRIVTVSAEPEWRAALKVRYDVFTKELEDDRYANHEDKTYRDEMDNSSRADLFVAVDDEGCIFGTTRVVYRQFGPFMFDERYNYEALSREIGVSVPELQRCVGLADRTAILAERRGGRVIFDLLNVACDVAGRKGVRYLVAIVKDSNPKMRSFVRFLRYREYDRCQVGDTLFHALYKRLDSDGDV